MTRARITRDPIDPASVAASVADPAHGATVLFIGTVREVNLGRTVTGLEYTAYEAMARDELAAIVAEAEQRFAGSRIGAAHRLGMLALAETSVVVAAAHPHRAAAFDACRFVVESLKRRVPIWKREQYTDGTLEWVSATVSDDMKDGHG